MTMQNNNIQVCDFRLHDIIDGRYRVERVLDVSDMTRKFKVVDPSGTEYTLTLFPLWKTERRKRGEMQSYIDNEIKSCRIKSCYLTAVSGTGMAEGNPYFLSEYVTAKDLLHCPKGKGFDVVRTAKAILYGLDDLHKSGKVHGRLSPEKILVTEDGNVLLTDYAGGGRKSMSPGAHRTGVSRPGLFDRIAAYKAPELLGPECSATVLPSADVFSFGVVLFQLLTAELPFGRLQSESDWVNYLARERSSEWNRNLLSRLENHEIWVGILDLCLAYDASGRAGNIGEILKKFPEDGYTYESMPGSQVKAPEVIQNGLSLHVMQGDETGRHFRLPEVMQLPRRIITVGRNDNSIFNMIPLKESVTSYISRRHFTMEYDDEADVWYVRDGQWDKTARGRWIRSLNGTFVNSERISAEGHKIVPGDIISVGEVKLRVEAY